MFNSAVFTGPGLPPPPAPSLAMQGQTIPHNVMRVRYGAIASGGGIYYKGFRAQATKGVVTANTPDACVGCS